MTVITIKKDIKGLERIEFEDPHDFFRYFILQDDLEIDDDFLDTKVDDKLVKKIEKAKKELSNKPDSFRRSIL